MRRLAAVLCAIVLAGCAPAATGRPSDGARGSDGVPPNGSGPVGASPGGSQVPVVAIPPATDAAAAAAAVLEATTDDARYAAVLGLLHGVQLGVYTSTGQAVVTGAERSADDVWIYDFEAFALATAVRDGDAIRLDDLAAQLSELASMNGATASEPQSLVSTIEASARTVEADASAAHGYALAAAVELERRGPFATDLGSPPVDQPVTLDALSAFLITLDIALPIVAGRQPDGVAFDGRVASAAGGPQPVAAGGCLSAGPAGPGEWIAGVNAGAFSALATVPNASFNRYLQAQLVGSIVEAKLSGGDGFHHRHMDELGSVPDDPQSYTFDLRVRPGAPTTPVACGPLAGAGFPPSTGQIIGAKVRWFHSGLESHAEAITTEDRQTNALGRAILDFDPKVEQYPSGIGPEVKDQLTIAATTNVLDALGTDLYTKLAGVPATQTRYKRIDVSWHRNYEITIDLTSLLKITQGSFYTGNLGSTSADGLLKITDFHAQGAAAQPPYIGGVVNPGTLNIGTTTGPNANKCNTEWIKPSGSATSIDWQVHDLQIWPLDKISLRMENGPNTEYPDTYQGLLCSPGGSVRTGPNKGSSWESYLYLGHPQGLVYAGGGFKGWVVILDDNVWATGGEVAHWHNEETCGGRCSGFLDMVVHVRPLTP